MKYRNIAIVSVRIFAIYVFILALNWLAIGGYQVITEIYKVTKDTVNILIGLIPVIILIVAGVLLWTFSTGISERIVVGCKAANEKSDCISINEIQVVAFTVVGLILLVNSFPEMIYRSLNIIAAQSQLQFMNTNYKIGIYLPLVRDITKFIIGTALFFGAQGFTGLLRKFRDALSNLKKI